VELAHIADSVDLARVLKKATVGVETGGGRRFSRPAAGTLLLTSDELVVVSAPTRRPRS